MAHVLETGIREHQKYGKRKQTSNRQNISKRKYIFLFLEKNYFKIPKNSIASAFFWLRQILKNIDMPQQILQHLLTA